MNISVYLFGSFKNGYSQYPNDYAKTIFEKFYQNAKSTTQVAINRDGDLMYYGYIRKLEAGNYLGLCTVINGKFLNSIEPLFSVYEGIIELMVKNGYLIHFGNNGEITTSTQRLYESAEEIGLITSCLQNSFDRLEEKTLPLPPLNYSISKGTTKSFSIQDGLDEIIKSSYSNSFTFVYKSKGFNSATLNSYIEIVGRKDKQISDLRNDLESCKSDLNKAQLAQKRFKAVAILSIGLFVISLISITLYHDKKKLGEDLASTQTELTNTQGHLNNTQGQLHNTQNELILTESKMRTALSTIDTLNKSIEIKNRNIESLKKQYQSCQKELAQAKQEVSSQKNINTQKDKRINDLISQINKNGNSSIAGSDLTIKLYNSTLNKWEYSNSVANWNIDKKWKSNKYIIYIYYKGNLLTQQQFVVK